MSHGDEVTGKHMMDNIDVERLESSSLGEGIKCTWVMEPAIINKYAAIKYWAFQLLKYLIVLFLIFFSTEDKRCVLSST
jgi:hypothetical protein